MATDPELITFLQQQFSGLHRRLEIHDERFRESTGHFEALFGQLETLRQEYLAIVAALRRIETAVGGERDARELLERDLAGVRAKITVLESRVGVLEARRPG